MARQSIYHSSPLPRLVQPGPSHISKSFVLQPCAHRKISSDEKPLPENDRPTSGPNQEQLPHISEEAAATAKATGESGPDLEQGTPVEDVIKRDKQAQESAPKVMQENQTPKGSRAFSTSSKTHQDLAIDVSSTGSHGPSEGQDHIFGIPPIPIPSGFNLKRRYEPIVEQVTKLMMRDGKLSIAQRSMSIILDRLRTSSPPSANVQKPLVAGSPPPTHLPLNPVAYLTTAIDSVAPLMRIKSLKGLAGGGAHLQMPVPLSLRQRRRTAFKWILDSAAKKPDKAIGKNQIANKVADELIAIVEGRSSVWEKRTSLHRLGINARANLGARLRKTSKKF